MIIPFYSQIGKNAVARALPKPVSRRDVASWCLHGAGEAQQIIVDHVVSFFGGVGAVARALERHTEDVGGLDVGGHCGETRFHAVPVPGAVFKRVEDGIHLLLEVGNLVARLVDFIGGLVDGKANIGRESARSAARSGV